jgi:hypothetical protein
LLTAAPFAIEEVATLMYFAPEIPKPCGPLAIARWVVGSDATIEFSEISPAHQWPGVGEATASITNSQNRTGLFME